MADAAVDAADAPAVQPVRLRLDASEEEVGFTDPRDVIAWFVKLPFSQPLALKTISIQHGGAHASLEDVLLHLIPSADGLHVVARGYPMIPLLVWTLDLDDAGRERTSFALTRPNEQLYERVVRRLDAPPISASA